MKVEEIRKSYNLIIWANDINPTIWYDHIELRTALKLISIYELNHNFNLFDYLMNDVFI